MAKNPYMKVLVVAGCYDLATPYYAAQYTFSHMGLGSAMRKNISWAAYPSGHRLYIDSETNTALKKNIAAFIDSLPKE